MVIKKIEIHNYRSINEISISPNDLCALIGPNGVGKSNILRALQIILGDTYPSERSFEKDDFFQKDSKQEIKIRIWFSEPLEPKRLTSFVTRGKVNVAVTSLELTHTKDPSNSFPTQFVAYDASGAKYWASNEVRNQIGFIYIPSERELNKEMSISQWTLIGKIMKKINENFRANPEPDGLSVVEKSFRNSMTSPTDILESDFSPSLTYKKFKDEFIKICEEQTKGLSGGFKLGLEIYDPLFYYKTVQITGIEDGGEFNALELGSGVQNLILISLFKTYAKLMKQNAILAVEEPEIYLYPQAQRQLYKNLVNMAEETGDGVAKTQVFYTTHNPNFVSAHRALDIELIHKDPTSGTYKLDKNTAVVTKEFLEKNEHKIYSHFNTERNEIFFADKNILVEGPSDRILLAEIMQSKWGVNLDQKGVSLIECGGKTGVGYFIGVCKLMGIKNFYAIWDKDDDSSGGVSDVVSKLLSDSITSGNGLELDPNLEDYINAHSAKKVSKAGNKIANAHNWAKDVDSSEIPDGLTQIKNFVLS